MNHILHILNKSPTERNAFATCFRMATPGDSILLIEDGVYGALENAEFAGQIKTRLDDFSFYVLGPDVAARGLGDTPLIKGIDTVDYTGFVELVAKNEVTQSWL